MEKLRLKQLKQLQKAKEKQRNSTIVQSNNSTGGKSKVVSIGKTSGAGPSSVRLGSRLGSRLGGISEAFSEFSSKKIICNEKVIPGKYETPPEDDGTRIFYESLL